MSTRRAAKATTENDSGAVRATRSTAKVSGSSPDSKKGSSKKKGTNAKSSKSASTDSSNMKQFINLTPEEKELMELVKKTANKADDSESPSKKEKFRDMEIEEEDEEDYESDEENELSEKEGMEDIIQTQLIPSVGKDSGTKSLNKTLDVQENENESEAALEGIGALEEISDLGGSPQAKAGGSHAQYMESQELTGLTNRLRPKVPVMESPLSEKAESVKSDMLNNIDSLAEIEEEKPKEIDQEVEKELAVGNLEGDMGTFEVDKDDEDEGDRVIMPSKDRMEEEQEQNNQKKKELEKKQLEEDREMLENATNVEVAPAHSDDSGETVEVIKPEIIRHSQEPTVFFDDKTPKSKEIFEETERNQQEEGEEEEEQIRPTQPQPNQDFTGEMEEQDAFDKYIGQSPKLAPEENVREAEEEKKEEVPPPVYNITKEEILQNYKFNRRSRIKSQQKKQESDDDEEEEKVFQEDDDDDDEENEEKNELYEEADELEKSVTKKKAGSSNVRREYAVYEDWRIMESLAVFERQHGTVGLKSINTWAAIRDPLTKKRLTDTGRTAESLKTRMYKTLALLTEEDKEQVKEYIQNHSKEEAMTAYIRFDTDKYTKQKKFKGIFNEPSAQSSNLQRKTPYNQKPAVTEKPKEKARLPGRVERAFEENSDDIEDPFLDEEPRRGNNSNPILPSIREVLDFSVHRTNSPAQKPVIFAPVQRNPIRTLKPIDRMEIMPYIKEEQSSRVSVISSRSGDRQKTSKKRKDYRMVSYPSGVQPPTELIEQVGHGLKRVKTDRYFEQRSLVISDEFKIKISREKFNPSRTDINVFVDHDNGFRQFAVVEASQDLEDHHNQNLIIERLSQIASKYRIRQEEVHSIFQSVSNDFDDLELYLKGRNPLIIWEASEDEDLLSSDQTAIRYLMQLKGVDRIIRRRQYLMGE